MVYGKMFCQIFASGNHFRLYGNILVLFFFTVTTVNAQLKLTYTDRWGLSSLSYKGDNLFDINAQKGAPINLEAFTYRNAAKQVLTEWSHVSSSKWDDKQKLYTINCGWGTLLCKYTQQADTILFTITFTNTTKSDTFYGLSFCPVGLTLDKRPSNFHPLYPYYGNNRIAPTLIHANLAKYKILIESTDLNDHTYIGFREENNSDGKRYSVWCGNRPFNGMTNFDTRSELRLAPGKSYTFSFALKFLKSDASLRSTSAPILSRFTKNNPYTLKWKDRRPVGMLFLSSYDESVSNKDNPRRWVIAPNNRLDNSIEGKKAFKKKLFDFADSSIAVLLQTHAQGVITWDIEGQQYPHPLSYIGSPELLPLLAPEMNAFADEYFQRFTSKGLKTGICIRPDSVVYYKEKNWIDHVAVKDPAATMIRKIAYARKRWGCSIFYIDSNIGTDGQPMNPEIFKKVGQKFPDVLLVPEHESTLYYASTAPYGEFRANELGVNNDIKELYPAAFMTLVVPEGFKPGTTVEQQRAILKESAAAGNIFLFRCWYHDEPVNSLIKSFY